MSRSLAEVIRRQLIPWSQQNAVERLVIARGEMSDAPLPPGAQLSRRKVRGRRTVVKNLRLYDNTRGVAAVWPAAGLNEVNKIKIACVLSGHIDYQVGEYSLRCGPGHFLFIAPGTPHPDGSRPYVDAEKSASCDLLFLLLHPNAIECWLSHCDEQSRQQTGKWLLLHEHASALLRALAVEIIAGEKESLAIGAQLLPGFFLMLLREAEAGRLQKVRSKSSPWLDEAEALHAMPGDFVTRLERHIQTNLHRPLTLDGASRAMLISRTQFTRRVRRETGKSFHELLTAQRLAEAKILLREAQWTVSAIAYMVGFKSASHFRAFFKEQTGQTPTAFRREITDANV
jgi:AraC-like DNA-binding protein